MRNPGDQETGQEANGSSLRSRSTAKCRESLPCTTYTDLSVLGYDITLCSMPGHPTISEEELIKKKDLLDPLDDDDDIKWKANPFDTD